MTLFILQAPESVLYRPYKPTMILLSSETAKTQYSEFTRQIQSQNTVYMQAISHSLVMVMLVNVQRVFPEEKISGSHLENTTCDNW